MFFFVLCRLNYARYSCESLCLYLIWDFVQFFDLDICFPAQVREVVKSLFHHTRFLPSFFPLLLRVLDANVSTLMLSLQSLKLLPFLLSSFFFCYTHWVLCTTLSSRSPIDSCHFLCCLFPIKRIFYSNFCIFQL